MAERQMPSPKLYFCGGTHGEFGALAKWNQLRQQETAFHVGDFGIGFKTTNRRGLISTVEQQAQTLGQQLAERQNRVYVIRGNHDDPSFFDGRTYGGLTLVPDNTVIVAHHQRVLCVGGAVSIDRSARIVGEKWDGESFGWNGCAPACEVVVTHAAGSWVRLSEDSNLRYWLAQDPAVVEELARERQQHDALLTALRTAQAHRGWFHGHYHKQLPRESQGIKFRGLAINEVVAWDLIPAAET